MDETPELILSVTAERGGMGKTAEPLKDLGDRMTLFFEGKTKKQVILCGHKRLSYQRLFRVMDTIREAGITEISLQAEEVKP